MVLRRKLCGHGSRAWRTSWVEKGCAGSGLVLSAGTAAGRRTGLQKGCDVYGQEDSRVNVLLPAAAWILLGTFSRKYSFNLQYLHVISESLGEKISSAGVKTVRIVERESFSIHLQMVAQVARCNVGWPEGP